MLATAWHNAAVLHLLPSLRLPAVAVSDRRGSRAHVLPGTRLQRTTDYRLDSTPNSSGFMSLGTAPSKGAVTRLSYPVTPDFSGCRLPNGFPWKAHVVSDRAQPSCAAGVALFPYAPSPGLIPGFTLQQVDSRLPEPPFPCRPTTRVSGFGLSRGGGLHPSALSVAWRALLEAPRFTVLVVLAEQLGASAPAH